MLKQITLPEWLNGLGSDELNGVVLTDDIDSLLSYYLLKQKFPSLKVVGYYDFKTLRVTEKIDLKKTLFIDCDMTNEKFQSIGNHRITEYKTNNINMNMYLDSMYKEYKEKFPFSTAMTVLFLFYSKHEIEKMSDELIRFILAIDSGHLGYYKNNGNWKQYHEKWLKEMKFEKFLKVLKNSKLEDFTNAQSNYSMDKKLLYRDGKFETDIDIVAIVFKFSIDLQSLYSKVELPKVKRFKSSFVSSFELKKIEMSEILSMAETYKNKYAITCMN